MPDVEMGVKWQTGDMAAAIHVRYGRRQLQELALSLGVPYFTVLQWRRVARRFPPEYRRDGLPWGVFQALATEPDRLELIDGEWTALSALAFVRARREAEMQPQQPEREPLRVTATEFHRTPGVVLKAAEVDRRVVEITRYGRVRARLVPADGVSA